MESCLRLAAAKLIADYLVNFADSPPAVETTRCVAFPGYSPAVVREVVARLEERRPDALIKIDSAYRADLDLPAKYFLDTSRERFTYYRNQRSSLTVLMPYDALSEERESQEAVDARDPDDVRSDVDTMINLLEDAETLFGQELAGFKQFVRLIIASAHPSLEEVVRYILRVHHLRESGEVTKHALGRALPELGAFCFRDAFRSLRLDHPNPTKWQKAIDRVVVAGREYAFKRDPRGRQFTPEDLLANFEAHNDKFADPHVREVLQNFIQAPLSDRAARERAVQLDWKADSVELLFSGPRQERLGLGKATLNHLQARLPSELPADEVSLLHGVDERPSMLEDERDALLDFYDKYRKEIGTNRKLAARWEKALLPRELEESDFLLALVKMAAFLFNRVRDERSSYHLVVELDRSLTPISLLERVSHAAIKYFTTRYRGLRELLAPHVVLKLDALERVLQYEQEYADEQKREEMDPNVREAFADFIREERATLAKNRLPFLAYLVTEAEGGVVPETRRSFTWVFPYNTFLAGFPDDLERHSPDPLRYYLLPRAIASAKGTAPAIALDEPRCVETNSARPIGHLVAAGHSDECIAIRDRVEKAVQELQADLLSSQDAAEVMQAIEDLGSLLRGAFSCFQQLGLAWSGWEEFAQQYGEKLNVLLSKNFGDRFARNVLQPVTMAGVAFIGRRERTAVVTPLHPLRLISLYVKAYQAKDLMVRLSSTTEDIVDPQLFTKVLEEDFNHPYYPEILVHQDRLLTVHRSLGDYSLLVAVEDAGVPAASNDSKADATDAARLLHDVVRDFVLLHPHERNNIQILLHSVKSERFAEAVADQLASDRELAGVRCDLILRDSDTQRLQAHYRALVNALNPEDPASADMAFLSRIGISAITSPRWAANSRPGDVDIAFLVDQISSTAEIRWQEPFSADDHPSALCDHFPARISRKRPGHTGQLRTSAYLCSPVSPEPIRTYYRAIASSVDPRYAKSRLTLPVRQVDYGSSDIRAVLQETHGVAKWVVNYDPLLDRNQLRNLGITVIRYRQGRSQRSLTISSTIKPYVVRAHLKKKLDALGLVPEGVDGSPALDMIIDEANRLSGSLLLTAAGRGYFTNELVGAILSRQLLTLRVPRELRSRAIFIYLDDYGTLFAHDGRLAGDLAQPARGLADLLCIVPVLQHNTVQLRLLVSEAKLLGSSTALMAEAKRSEEQLLKTFDKLHKVLREVPAVDSTAWLHTLANLIINSGEARPGCDDLERIAWLVRQGKVEVILEGHSHVFVMDDVTCSCQNVSEIENMWQWILGAHETRTLLRSLVDINAGSEIMGLLPKPPQAAKVHLVGRGRGADDPQGTDTPSHADTNSGTHSRGTQGGSDLSDQPIRPKVEHGPSAQHHAFAWARPEVAALLAAITDPNDRPEDRNALSQELATVEQKVKNFLPHFGIRAKLGQSTVTPNAFRVRIEGQIGVHAAKIEKLRDQFKTVQALDLIRVEAEPGYLALSFRRSQRGIVSYLQCLRHRSVSGSRANTKILLGKREDNGALLYYDFNGADSHALIGGMSNSGKSQLLGMMILDLLLTNDPKYLHLVLIDPKQVEFPRFRRVPHLHGHPIVRHKHEAMEVLSNLTAEMDRRYGLMGEWEVNDIEKYNSLPGVKILPRIVVIFDEVADWMLDDDFKKAVNDSFQRLAGKARAAGIHLILSTQRPDNTVISPLLRANLGAKIALRVDKKSNSEIILDEGGAEHLLGQGHGLAKLGGERHLFQSAFVPDVVRDRILEALAEAYTNTTDHV